MEGISSDDLVLIVGAGPTGLVTAIDLARRGINVRIVDKAAGPSPASRAKGLQPRALEVFHNLGIVGAVLDGGGRFPRWRSYAGTTLLWERSIYELIGINEPVASMDVPYPETWMIPQWRTESILRDRLAEFGVSVEFGVEFTGCTQDGSGVLASLRNPAGTEQLRCRYLVGADGGRSAVRKALAIPFPGETREDERFLIADVEAPALDHDYWHNWSVGGDAVLRISMCPLPKTACFQFVAPIMPGSPEPDLMLDTLQRLLEARSGRQDIALTKLMWVTLHRTNLRLAARYREGSVFLAGDAAHAPPQAGGQGLNISVQDAVNLSWKLAAALNGAPDALLGSYGAERRAVAAAKLGLLSAELQATGQCNAVEAERRQLAIKEDIFHLELNYRSSPLVREARCDVQGVQAGDRAPDALTFDPSGQSMRLFDLFRGPQSTLLAFSQDSASVCADALKDQRAEIRLHVIDGTVEAPVHEIYGVKAGASTILLVRPDGYIGLAADSDLRNELLRYCAGVFGW